MTKQSHPEHVCERCHGANIVWFVDSALWNRVHGIFDILCPTCFVCLAEAAGIRPTSWQLAPEHHEPGADALARVKSVLPDLDPYDARVVQAAIDGFPENR
jgi:hypothetical protein